MTSTGCRPAGSTRRRAGPESRTSKPLPRLPRRRCMRGSRACGRRGSWGSPRDIDAVDRGHAPHRAGLAHATDVAAAETAPHHPITPSLRPPRHRLERSLGTGHSDGPHNSPRRCGVLQSGARSPRTGRSPRRPDRGVHYRRRPAVFLFRPARNVLRRFPSLLSTASCRRGSSPTRTRRRRSRSLPGLRRRRTRPPPRSRRGRCGRACRMPSFSAPSMDLSRATR